MEIKKLKIKAKQESELLHPFISVLAFFKEISTVKLVSDLNCLTVSIIVKPEAEMNAQQIKKDLQNVICFYNDNKRNAFEDFDLDLHKSANYWIWDLSFPWRGLNLNNLFFITRLFQDYFPQIIFNTQVNLDEEEAVFHQANINFYAMHPEKYLSERNVNAYWDGEKILVYDY